MSQRDWFFTSGSELPLRVRERPRKPEPPPKTAQQVFTESVEQLIVVPDLPGTWRRSLIDPFFCPLEALDASHEDENGRLPHEPGYIDPATTRRNHMAMTDQLTHGRRSKILRRLTEGPANTRELEKLCRVSKGALGVLLRDLEREEAIFVTQPGLRGKPQVYSIEGGHVEHDKMAESDEQPDPDLMDQAEFMAHTAANERLLGYVHIYTPRQTIGEEIAFAVCRLYDDNLGFVQSWLADNHAGLLADAQASDLAEQLRGFAEAEQAKALGRALTDEQREVLRNAVAVLTGEREQTEV